MIIIADLDTQDGYYIIHPINMNINLGLSIFYALDMSDTELKK